MLEASRLRRIARLETSGKRICRQRPRVGTGARTRALFEQSAIFVIERDALTVVGCFDGTRQEAGSFSSRLHAPADEPKYRIYVVRLDDAVLNKKRFREANPNHQPGKPCYYVGMTSLTPEQRFAQHQAGIKDCSFVREFGLHLARKKFEHIPLLGRTAAEATEISHAEALRAQGYAVWQN